MLNPSGGFGWINEVDRGGSTFIMDSGGSRFWILIDQYPYFDYFVRWLRNSKAITINDTGCKLKLRIQNLIFD